MDVSFSSFLCAKEKDRMGYGGIPRDNNKKKGNDDVPIFVVQGGFEPPQTEPKPVVLPLHHWTSMLFAGAKVIIFCHTAKKFN